MKRKRFIRLLMAEGWSRNEAAVIAGHLDHCYQDLYDGMRMRQVRYDPIHITLVRAAVRRHFPYKGL